MPRFQDWLRGIAANASPRTGFLFAFAFVLLLVWIILAALGVGT